MKNDTNFLFCNKCDFSTDLSRPHPPVSTHYSTHAQTLPSMAPLSFFHAHLSPKIFYCVDCSQAHPTLTSLFLHELTAGHMGALRAYCFLCRQFVDKTTLLNHFLFHHPVQPCEICKIKLPIFSLLEHNLMACAHLDRTLDNILTFFNPGLRTLIGDSRHLNQFSTISGLQLAPVLLGSTVFNPLAPLFSDTGFQTLALEAFPPSFPRGLIQMLSDSANYLVASQLHSLLSTYDENSNFESQADSLRANRTQLFQLVLLRFMETLHLRSETITPAQLPLLLIGPVSSTDHTHRYLGPTPIADTASLVTLLRTPTPHALLVGSCKLRHLGTPAHESFHLLNLSSPTPSLCPTHTFSGRLETPYCGFVDSTSFHKLPVLHSTSFFVHVSKVFSALRANIPIFLEFDVSLLLNCLPTHNLQPFIDNDLYLVIISYFSQLTQLLRSMPSSLTCHQSIIIVNQAPFLLPTLSPAANMSLYRTISNYVVHLSQAFKYPIITPYGVIGVSETHKSCFFSPRHPVPMFLPSGAYSDQTNQEFVKLFEAIVNEFQTFQALTALRA